MKVLITSKCSTSVKIKYWKKVGLFGNVSQAIISTQTGDIYVIKAGYIVYYPAGLCSEWEETKSIKKNYRLGR